MDGNSHVTVDVRFDADVFVETISQPVSGYIQLIGLTANSNGEVTAILKESTSDYSNSNVLIVEESLFTESEISKKLIEDPDVGNSVLQSPNIPGIWYKSGRGFYRDSLMTKLFEKIKSLLRGQSSHQNIRNR